MMDNGEISKVIDILYVMKDNIRMRIMDMLYTSGENGASFKNMVKAAGINPTNLVYHLNMICSKGLAEKKFRNEEGRRDYSFYNITTLGELAYLSARRIFRDMNSIDTSAYHDVLPDIEIVDPRQGPKCISFKI